MYTLVLVFFFVTSSATTSTSQQVSGIKTLEQCHAEGNKAAANLKSQELPQGSTRSVLQYVCIKTEK
jgi:hypothetical protein